MPDYDEIFGNQASVLSKREEIISKKIDQIRKQGERIRREYDKKEKSLNLAIDRIRRNCPHKTRRHTIAAYGMQGSDYCAACDKRL